MMHDDQQQPLKVMLLPATPTETVALNGAINFALKYAIYLPPESKVLLSAFQRRLMTYLPHTSTEQGTGGN